MTTAAEIARQFIEAVEADGLTFNITGTTVRISHTFEPGDTAGFMRLDCDATASLQILPNNGSTYGVDGVGGAIALQDGFGTVKHTGVRKSVITALTKAKEAQRQ